MNYVCGNCGWWQGLKDPECKQAECRAKAPGVVTEENSERYPIGTVIFPIMNRDEPKCGAHEFKGQVDCGIEINPPPIPPGAAEKVVRTIQDCQMEEALKAFDDEWRKDHGSIPAQDVRRLVKHAIERFVGDRR